MNKIFALLILAFIRLGNRGWNWATAVARGLAWGSGLKVGGVFYNEGQYQSHLAFERQGVIITLVQLSDYLEGDNLLPYLNEKFPL